LGVARQKEKSDKRVFGKIGWF